MRTNSYLSAAARHSSLSLLSLSLVFVLVLPALAGGLQNPPITSYPTAYAYYGPGQENHPSAQNVSLPSSPNPIELLDTSSVSPETLGDLLMIHQHYLAAIEAYQRAPQNSAVVLNKLGIAYQHMYALDIAKLEYEKALFIEPKYAEAINNLGTIYYGKQDYHKAEKYYRQAIHLKHNDASFYSNLGTAYFADHDYKHGMAAYRKAFSIDPNVFINSSLAQIEELGPQDEQITLNYDLAELYAQAGMVDAAIHYLRMAFIAGFKDHKRLMEDKSFAKLRLTPQFQLLLTEEHIKNPNGSEQSMIVQSGQHLQ
ncbi:MAG TPA: tetratricopeptide repeat protein [Acidobacteriaceae bacterium]|nr:tetratricopeptide repeat protein [Acidobacteriaceae bacterium]